jgi:fucose permease
VWEGVSGGDGMTGRGMGVLALVAFVSLGLPDGVLGVAWPSMRASLGVDLAQLGVLLAAAMVGYVVSTASTGAVVARHGVGWLLVVSSALMVGSGLAYALAPAWPVPLVGSLLAGLGSGAIDAGVNAYAAFHFSPRLVSWLHAAYGVGATLGPLIMTAMLTTAMGWRWGYGVIAALLLGMTLAFSLTRACWDDRRDGSPGGPDPAAPGPWATLGRPAVWSGLVFFFVYAGLEVTAGQWAYSLLTEGRGLAPGAAGLWVGGFWGAMTVIAGGLAGRVRPASLLRGVTLLVPVAAVALAVDLGPAASGLALVALGLLLAPIYPLAVVATPARVGEPSATRVIGYQVGAAYLGTAVIPGLAGVLARAHGLEAVGAVLVTTAGVVLVLAEKQRRTGRAGSDPGRPPREVAARSG